MLKKYLRRLILWLIKELDSFLSEDVTMLLVRHGESESNVGLVATHDVGDHTIGLTPLGWDQARQRGRIIGREFLLNALIYVSPYRRTRETLQGILEGAGVKRGECLIYEDPRLREVEPGYEDRGEQEHLRRKYGWYYYRFDGGESPADASDRSESHIDSMMRQIRRKRKPRVLVVSHGLTIRCHVMRFLHLTVEQFESMANPDNCGQIEVAEKTKHQDPLFTSGKWGVWGVRIRRKGE